ncbi:MAG: ribosomal subunit interface protein [Candidatus Yanofskybacteria bacterium RIFCSPHIGHO2_01_FULL_41_21]|uniref:Ribosomal subunit interface protein n=1 Tax=Candidatus Yanofskybacteria bacterium RIFCSPHIGHO2_01_FULL_41_21 TaxID=1802660 RepID=A0A1F8EBD7_9BACT|nr:MAG: ribosomal subunit interface protein [Candidatus Yanofskybacteria bacterium RIFCSPHIGHO2_01_FULL_41_21]
MKINITTKNITLDEPLRVFIEQKIGALEKFVQKSPVSVSVEIGKPSRHHKTGSVFYAEVNLKVGGDLLRGEGSNKDLRTAINEARDELHIQIKKLKERRKDLSRKPKK